MRQVYRFLPFRFTHIDDKMLLVNDVGEYLFLNEPTFDSLVRRQHDLDYQEYLNLKSRNMIYDGQLSHVAELLATKYRTKKQFLNNFTTLHMFVVTRRCNQKCLYCHASSVDSSEGSTFDMDSVTARKCVALALKSPSSTTKIEFQGGEPLLNFEVVKEIVEYAIELNESAKKRLEFVICSNLLALDEKKLDYIKSRNICLSTSLDGPRDLHDACRRKRNGDGSHEIVTRHLALAQAELGKDKVSALMTATRHSIDRFPEVVEEYLKQNLGSVFIRMMNPLGLAFSEWNNLGYTMETFISAYSKVLDNIIEINRSGVHFPEMFATILLSRILTPFSTGFVDLQSPAGVGIGGVIYDTNGDVYVSDEARMLSHAKGDKKFCIGNVHLHSWFEIFGNEELKKIIQCSCIEALPGCAWCAFQPYCGGDPVRNYALYGDMIGKRPENDFCRKHKALFELFFNYIQRDDNEIHDIFWSWITNRSLDTVRLNSHVEE
jgi:uncharacterized protein